MDGRYTNRLVYIDVGAIRSSIIRLMEDKQGDVDKPFHERMGISKETLHNVLNDDLTPLSTFMAVIRKLGLRGWLVLPEDKGEGFYFEVEAKMRLIGLRLKEYGGQDGKLPGMSVYAAKRIIDNEEVEAEEIVDAVWAIWNYGKCTNGMWMRNPHPETQDASWRRRERQPVSDPGADCSHKPDPDDGADGFSGSISDSGADPCPVLVLNPGVGRGQEDGNLETTAQSETAEEAPTGIMERTGSLVLSECAGILYLTVTDGKPIGRTFRLYPAAVPIMAARLLNHGRGMDLACPGADGQMLCLNCEDDGVVVSIGDAFVRMTFAQAESCAEAIKAYGGGSA